MSVANPGSGGDMMAVDRALVVTLAVALRTAELYRADNAVAVAVVDRLNAQLTRRTAFGPFDLEVRNRCVFADGRRVRLTAADYPRFVYLMRVFEEWGIQGFSFHAQLSIGQIVDFLWAVANDRTGSVAALLDRLDAASLSDLDVVEADQAGRSSTRNVDADASGAEGAQGGASGGPQGEGVHTFGGATDTAYLRGVTAAQNANDGLRQGDRLAARRIRRVTQSIVDEIMRDPTSLLALTTIKDYDIYLFAHSVNVAILSGMLGLRMGFTKTQLGELVLAAFLHDMGKTQLPEDLVGKPAALTDGEWKEMKRHPELGALSIVGQRHLTRSMMRALRVAFEHHMDYDLGGYPRLEGLAVASKFSLIVMVADRYDALTTPRPYRRHNFTPPEAIALMVGNAGAALDAAVLRYFIEMMGIYRVGTLLRLASGAVGVVESPPAEGAPSNRPVVRLLADNSRVDLAELDAAGAFLHQIVEIVNPGNVGQVPAVGPERLVLEEDVDVDLT